MSDLTIITHDGEFSKALGRALHFLHTGRLTRLDSIAEMGDRAGHGLVLDIGPERDRHGTVEGFYLLRHLLMKPECSFDAHIALVCSQKCLFSDERQQIPPSEGVKLFSIPFDLAELLSFVTSSKKPKGRRYTRMFLRGRLNTEDVQALARGDTHRLAHFDMLVQQIEAALYENRRDAFVCLGDEVLKGRYYTNRVLAADAMLDSLREIVSGDKDAAVREALDRLTEVCVYFHGLASFLDAATSNEVVPVRAWSIVLGRLRSMLTRNVRETNAKWTSAWQQICERVVCAAGRKS